MYMCYLIKYLYSLYNKALIIIRLKALLYLHVAA